MRTWEVTLSVIGNIRIQRKFSFQFEKELHLGNVFNSDLTLSNIKHGIEIQTTVRTQNRENAQKVASLFIGKMLDVLALRLNMPVEVYINEKIENIKTDDVKAMVTQQEFEQCFRDSRSLNLDINYRTFLRGLNWFRKGLYTSDPIDKFFAFWNSISIVGQKYFRPGDRTTGAGSINQICDCFEQLWGASENWTLINRDPLWVNRNNELRNDIAHGTFQIEIESINDVISRIDKLQEVAHEFLRQWANERIEIMENDY